MAAVRKIHPHLHTDPYDRIRSIDGSHPFKEKVPGAYVEYRVRKRKGGKVLYFNFELAKEMGLIPASHEHRLNPMLSHALLDTFAIQIINEYDIIHNTEISPKDVKENMYMATRYLQLQHPNKTGLTSGDGRSIWNGYFSNGGKAWDISSCGTGATCLSPATAINKKFYRTGDPFVSYGCGYSDVSEGIGNAIFSEIFHRNGIKTERTLCIIEFPRGLSINVRAGKNLLRPSHFFNHLKQENYPRLANAVNFFIDRQITNGEFANVRGEKARYQQLLQYVAETFGTICAKFEREYIFCWLDWDGDNVLSDGGIIDYGSIRQFGLFHHEYRYDDVDRYSTNLIEQKKKARYTVQVFIQLVDYLITKKKKRIEAFRKHPALKMFDKVFEHQSKAMLLEKVGYATEDVEFLLSSHKKAVDAFQKEFAHFEKTTSSVGKIEIEDGITENAIFCMRDALRELPKVLKHDNRPIDAESFIQMIKSSYATRKDLRINSARRRRVKAYQAAYLKLVFLIAQKKRTTLTQQLAVLASRSAILNRYERITGDGMIHVAGKLVRNRKKMPQQTLQKLVEDFIENQVLIPEKRTKKIYALRVARSNLDRFLASMQRLVKNYREGL